MFPNGIIEHTQSHTEVSEVYLSPCLCAYTVKTLFFVVLQDTD